MVKDMITKQVMMKKVELSQLKEVTPLKGMHLIAKKFIAAMVVMSVAVTFVVTPTLAMNNPICSYTYKHGQINLLSIVAPYGSTELNIPSEINGTPVGYIDESFIMYEVSQPREEISLRPIVWNGANVNLKSVNFPETVQSMPKSMVEHVRKYYQRMPVVLNIYEMTSLFESDVAYGSAYEYGYYSLRKPKVTTPDVSLADICEKADVYVDGVKFENCVSLDGVTYISFKQFKETAGIEDNPPFPYQAGTYNPTRYDSKLMGYRYAVSKNPAYLNSDGEYCSENGAEYIECFKRIIANAYTGELMIREYYDEITSKPRAEGAFIPGGEIKIIETPIFPDYMPLRAAYEGLGFNVEWDETTKTVYVTSPTE